MQEYRILFVENSITGAVLFDLTEEDLEELKIVKLGDRKRLLRSIQQLKQSSVEAAYPPPADQSSSKTRITLKCYYNNEFVIVDLPNTNPSFEDLQKHIETAFNEKLRIHCDVNSQILPITNSDQLQHAIRNSGKKLKLHLNPHSIISRREMDIYDALANPVCFFFSFSCCF